MSQFMLFIKATGNPIGNLPQEKQEAHIKKVGGYIQNLAVNGSLKNAQPLIPNGVVVSNLDGSFSETAIDEKQEMIVGFYHIQAKNMTDAIKIAKSDPRFKDGKWRIEIREIMKVEGIN
jgi:hypothetical protein